MMKIKDEYVMMESIFNENRNIFLEEEVNEFNKFKESIFKKMGFESVPTESEWMKPEFREKHAKAISKLENFVQEKIKIKNLTKSSLRIWISDKKKMLESSIIKPFMNLKTTYSEEYTINEMTANGIAMTIPISYLVFVLLMVFMEGAITNIKNKFSKKG